MYYIHMNDIIRPSKDKKNKPIRATRGKELTMNFTICTIKDYAGNMEVSVDKSGNQYTVCLHHNELHENTRAYFSDIKDAYAVFEMLARAIVTGCYSYETRKAMIHS